MKLKLAVLKVILTVLSVLILIISFTSVFPAMTGEIDIDIPSEEEIEWDVQENDLLLRGDMWVNNSGYYSMEDINIRVEIIGFNRSLFNDTIYVPSVEKGENKRIELELQTSLDDFTEEELEDLVFEGIDLKIISDMNANYPFSILHFNLDYESTVEWEGLVETLEYKEDNIDLTSNAEGAVVSLPYTVETNKYLSGESIIELGLYDENKEELYSSTELTVPLGVYESDTVDFLIDDHLIEELIFNSQELVLTSQIAFSDFDQEFEEEEIYFWEAPVEDLDLKYNEAHVTYSAGETTLYLPYQVNTPRLSGEAIVDIVMLDGERNNRYSSDEQMIPLGSDYHGELNFSIDEQDSEKFITTSHLLLFDMDIHLIDDDISFNTHETYEWGAPLNDLEIGNIRYDLTTGTGSATFSFINDSPRRLEMELDISIYDEDDIEIGSKFISYQDNQDYIVNSGEEFIDTIETEVDDVPSYALVTFTDDNTGMQLEKRVEVD
ncbi:MAG: hypothetical protein ACQEQM_01515 [Thermoplasmatota archaeon]